jgi:uncharacterized membrane protein YdjX (TVP38/TMEM64 family)
MEKSADPRTHTPPLIFTGYLVVLAVGSYFRYPGFHDFVNTACEVLASGENQRIQSWVRQFGAWGPAAVVAGMILQMFLFVIPTLVLMIASVLAYGPFWGLALIMASVFAASSIGFWIGKWFGPVTVQKMVGAEKVEKVENLVNRYGFWVIVVARLSPILSNDAISFAGGLLRMQYPKFIGATLAGTLPLAAILAFVGKDTSNIETPLILLSGLSLLGVAAYIYQDHQKRKSADAES